MKFLDLDPVAELLRDRFPSYRVQSWPGIPTDRLWATLSGSGPDLDDYTLAQVWVHTDGSFFAQGKIRTGKDRVLVAAILSEIQSQFGEAVG